MKENDPSRSFFFIDTFHVTHRYLSCIIAFLKVLGDPQDSDVLPIPSLKTGYPTAPKVPFIHSFIHFPWQRCGATITALRNGQASEEIRIHLTRSEVALSLSRATPPCMYLYVYNAM